MKNKVHGIPLKIFNTSMTKYYARFPTVLGGTQSQLIEGQQSNCCSP